MGAELFLASMLLVGLFGSLHCAAMCSPFAAAAGRRGLRATALYSAGRLTSYAALGGLAGLVGAGAHASLAAITDGPMLVALLAGLALMGLGMRSLLPRKDGGPVPSSAPLARLYLRLVPLVRACRGAGGPGHVYALGVLNGLLPCPVTAPALLAALAGGSAAVGSLLLMSLGLGTLPVMIIAGHFGGYVLNLIAGRLNSRNADRATAGGPRYAPGLLMLLLGLVTAARPFLQIGAAGTTSHLH